MLKYKTWPQNRRENLVISAHRRSVRPESDDLIDSLSGKNGSNLINRQAWENLLKHWPPGRLCAQINLLRPLVENGHAFDVFIWARKNGIEPIMEMVKESDNFLRGSPMDIAPEEILAFYEKLAQWDEINSPERKPDKLVPPVYGSPCTLMETSLHITVDGDIVLCVGNANISYGSINYNGLEAAVKSPLRLAIRDYHNWIVGPCRDCELFDLCRGGCRGNAKAETGCPRASNPYCWKHDKNISFKEMMPASCQGCILENHPGCSLK